MPFLGIGAHILIALFFGIHALRTGRNMYWLFILFAFPLLGSIAYFFVEFLPELRDSRALRSTGRAVRSALDPGRELRAAREAVELSPSVDNRTRLAAALLAAGDHAGAIAQYQEAAVGLHEFDPTLNVGLARALLAENRPIEARSVIERFIAQEKGRLPSDMPLLYARALAECKDTAAAEAQFSRVLQDEPSPEARCSYGAFLQTIGKSEQAQTVFRELLADARHWPGKVRSLHREWLTVAEQALRRS